MATKSGKRHEQARRAEIEKAKADEAAKKLADEKAKAERVQADADRLIRLAKIGVRVLSCA